jgi:hypothetical protein
LLLGGNMIFRLKAMNVEITGKALLFATIGMRKKERLIGTSTKYPMI